MGGPGQTRLMLGVFTLYPAFGSIQPNGHQTVTVDYVAETEGISEEVGDLFNSLPVACIQTGRAENSGSTKLCKTCPSVTSLFTVIFRLHSRASFNMLSR